MALPLDRFFNAIYVWVLQRLDDEDRDTFLVRLYDPLPGRESSPQAIQQEMDQFAEFASAFGVTPPPSG
jgi:hypothetical protein